MTTSIGTLTNNKYNVCFSLIASNIMITTEILSLIVRFSIQDFRLSQLSLATLSMCKSSMVACGRSLSGLERRTCYALDVA